MRKSRPSRTAATSWDVDQHGSRLAVIGRAGAIGRIPPDALLGADAMAARVGPIS
jgi:hypothetical protein